MRRALLIWGVLLLGVAAVVTAVRSRLSPRGSPAAAPSTEALNAEVGGGGLKRWIFKIVPSLAVLGVGGLAVAASGIIPIKASSGHWAITA